MVPLHILLIIFNNKSSLYPTNNGGKEVLVCGTPARAVGRKGSGALASAGWRPRQTGRRRTTNVGRLANRTVSSGVVTMREKETFLDAHTVSHLHTWLVVEVNGELDLGEDPTPNTPLPFMNTC
jgi:hypothetical protein